MPARERLFTTLVDLSGTAVRTRADVQQSVLRAALRLSGAHGATLVLPVRRRFERASLLAVGARPAADELAEDTGEFLRRLLRVSRPVYLADLAAETRDHQGCPGLEPGPTLFVPLRLREQQAGYLSVHRRPGAPRFEAADAQQVLLLAAWTAMVLENLRLAENVERLAVTDDLTQVYNYRFLKSALRRELKRAGRFGQELSVVMVDVDNLKGYNDRNGHVRGSFLLKEMAALLAAQVRSFDLVAKYGGDEFTLILPQTGREGAATVAERMRQAVASHAFPLVPSGAITISLGVATFPTDGPDAGALIRAADLALYAAKQHGRNRVTSYERAVA